MEAQQRNRYQFKDVLVADTHLVADSSGRWPDIITLNNKISKCFNTTNSLNNTNNDTNKPETPETSHQEKYSAHQANCPQSCCLEAEESEFRRRSSLSLAPLRTCFAKCSDRQPMDIELLADAKLSGKLVILALTRATHPSRRHRSWPLKCRPVYSSSFGLFQPEKGSDLNLQPGINSGTDKRAHSSQSSTSYARLSQNQVPSLAFDSINIDWNARQRRSSLSIDVSSSLVKHLPNNKSLFRQETLLVAEFECQPSPEIFSLVEDDDPTSGQSLRVHLLSLINRDSNFSRPTIVDNVSQTVQPIIDQQQHQQSSTISIRIVEASEPRRVTTAASTRLILTPNKHHPVGRPSGSETLSQSPSQSARPSTKLLERSSSIDPGIIDRMDESLSPMTIGQGIVSSQAPGFLGDTQGRSFQPQTNVNRRNPVGGSFQLGPAYVSGTSNEFVENLRTHLRQNSLLVFTISSSLLILTYSICLLMYFRSRKTRSPGSSNSRGLVEVRPQASDLGNTNINISRPFNLRMAPATQTRLEMMLRGSRPGRTRAHRRPGSSNPIVAVSVDANSAQSFGGISGSHLLRRAWLPADDESGTIKLARALRRAAALARARLGVKTTPARAAYPHQGELKVIPEEQQPVASSFEEEESGGCCAGDTDAAQLEHLIQTAMANECNHSYHLYQSEQHQHPHPHRSRSIQSGANMGQQTLFANPNRCEKEDIIVGVEGEGNLRTTRRWPPSGETDPDSDETHTAPSAESSGDQNPATSSSESGKLSTSSPGENQKAFGDYIRQQDEQKTLGSARRANGKEIIISRTDILRNAKRDESHYEPFASRDQTSKGSSNTIARKQLDS